MKIGMLWFDRDPKKTLTQKVMEAAGYYRDKYRAPANCCYVHPSMSPDGNLQVDGVAVRTSKAVLPNHLWVGEEAEETNAP